MALPARFWSLVGVTVLAHGAVLSALHTMQPDVRPAVAPRPPALVFRARVLGAPATEPSSEPQAPAASLRAAEPARGPEAPPPPIAPERSAPAPVAVAATSTLPSDPVTAAAPAASAATGDDAPYLPRRLLTVPPTLLGAVDVPFPEDVQGVVDLKVQITLFIDEDGRVRRIRVDTPQPVHPAFERVLRETWGEARFTPGELHQVPVRSQIRLEVDFEAGARPQRGTS